MPAASRLQVPQGPPDPRRSLLQRLGVACGIVVFIALLTWLGRDGYSDADRTPISPLDAL